MSGLVSSFVSSCSLEAAASVRERTVGWGSIICVRSSSGGGARVTAGGAERPPGTLNRTHRNGFRQGERRNGRAAADVGDWRRTTGQGRGLVHHLPDHADCG